VTAGESSLDVPDQRSEATGAAQPRYQKQAGAWRARFEGSFAEDFVKGLGVTGFGDRILILWPPGCCPFLVIFVRA
jgi:hypothetical protein